MRAVSSALVAAMAVALSAQSAEGKDAQGGSLFRSIFGSANKKPTWADADQAALVDWLIQHDFGEYSSKAWMEKFDDELAYDSIEDFTHILDEDEYDELSIPRETATRMQEAARKTMMEKFLAAVPIPEGADEDVFTKLVAPLLAAGYDEPETVADLTKEDATKMGIDMAHYTLLATYGEEWDARELLHVLLTTYEAGEGKASPFEHRGVRKPLIDALVKAGVRKIEDIHSVAAQEGIPEELLTALKNDPRVLQHSRKQEL